MSTGRGAILWDFDGTLASRPRMWSGLLIETLDLHEPGHTVALEAIRPWLRNGFFWNAPEVPHCELTPRAWWDIVEGRLARAYESVGFASHRAGELATLAHERYCDHRFGWRVFDDTRPVLGELASSGWRHVVLSNHIPELESLVVGLGLGDLVSATITSGRIGYEKPHPEAFGAGRRAAGDAPELWMVGDNVDADVIGAEAVGIPAILVRNPSERAKRFAPSLENVAPYLRQGAGKR